MPMSIPTSIRPQLQVQRVPVKVPIRRPVLIITLLLLIQVQLQVKQVSSYSITVPNTKNDFKQLSSLLIESFDEPSIMSNNNNDNNDNNNNNKMNDQIDKITWSLYDKFLTEQYTYQQYTNVAKKMKGKKYALYVAKEYNPGINSNTSNGNGNGNNGNESARPYYEVIGMVELGMVLTPTRIQKEILQGVATEPVPVSTTATISMVGNGSNSTTATTTTMTTSNSDINNNNNNNNNNKNEITILRPKPTIGVLCVKKSHMNKGVGKALIQKCEEDVKNIWNETELYIEVERCNENAKSFFMSSCGYDVCYIDGNVSGGGNGNDRIEMERNVKVSRRRKVEERPHLVLSKII
jgi:hypothetical protein